MKLKQKKTTKKLLSDKIADALTVKPRADIEDDQVFGTKPKTVTREDIDSSDSEVDAAISDFRKRNVTLLSEVSKKYEGHVVSRKDMEETDEDDESDSNDVPTVKKQPSTSKRDVPSDSEDTNSEIELPVSKTVEENSDDSDGSESDAESEDYSITQFKKQLNEDSEENEEDESDDGGGDDDDDEGDGYDISQMDEPMKEAFEHIKKQNVSEETKKGNAVRNQLLIWEGLLEMRIHLQRCVNTVNQMPLPETYSEMKENNEFVEETNNTKANIATVLDKLMTLQNMLLNNYSETKTLCNTKQKTSNGEKEKPQEDDDEEIPSDTDNEEIPSDTDDETPKNDKTTKSNINNGVSKKRKLEEYENELSNTHKAFKTFRDNSIQKWNEKTRLTTATSIKSAPTNTVLQQISYILSDRERLIKRTQLKRSEYDIIGYKKEPTLENNDENETEGMSQPKDRKENDEYIPEIFDDSDFYHQLLRELIECKSADISDPVQLSRQWIALQQMRSKMKRKVDTKATKGRKIKYVVHNKLVNFMGPEKNTLYTDESKNELYSSLFGKLFEQNNVGVNTNGFKLKN